MAATDFQFKYVPLDPKIDSVSVEGMVVTQDGYISVGPHVKLHKWVDKSLRVKMTKIKKVGAVPDKTTAPAESVRPEDANADEPYIDINTVQVMRIQDAKKMEFKRLKAYAARFNVTARGHKQLITRLHEIGKLA